MKKRITALILSLTLLLCTGIVSAEAAGNGKSGVTFPDFGVITEYFRSIFDGIFGRRIPSGIKYTLTGGEIFEKGAKTPSAHASTVLKMPDGRLMSAWFGGKGEGEDDVRIWYSFFSDGAWSEPDVIQSGDTVAHWNPVLQDFGSFARLYFKVGTDTKVWVTKYCDYSYSLKTWSSVNELVAGDTSGGRGPVKDKCLVTSKGLIIAGSSTEQGDWRAFFDISADGGKTWTKTGYVETPKTLFGAVQMIQPTLWEDADGNVHALFRTKSGKIFRSDSADGGYTWCKAYPTSLPNNNSGIDLVKTDNGYIWLAYNPASVGVRNRLKLAVSKDNGETWEDVCYLERSINLFSEFSYPAVISDGNRLYITYTCKREVIKYAFIEFES